MEKLAQELKDALERNDHDELSGFLKKIESEIRKGKNELRDIDDDVFLRDTKTDLNNFLKGKLDISFVKDTVNNYIEAEEEEKQREREIPGIKNLHAFNSMAHEM